MLGLFAPILIEPARQLAIDPVSAAIIGLCTIAAFILALKRPTLAVAMLFVTDEIEWTHVHGTFSLSLSVMVGSAVGIAFLTQAELRRTLLRPAVRRVGIGFCVVMGATLMSLARTEHPQLVGVELIKLLEYAITFAVAHAAFATRRDESLAFSAVATAGIVVSIGALAQLVTGAPAGVTIASHLVPRIAGLLAGPNQLAGYLGLLLPVLLVAVIDTRSRLARASLALVILALIGTFSRGGLFGAAVASLVVLQMRPAAARIRVWFLQAGIATAVLIAVGLVAGMRAEGNAQPDGLGTRSQLWHAAIALFRGNPIVGVGAGNFEMRLASVGYPTLHTHANSWYFEALADGGIVLFAGTLVWIRQVVAVLSQGIPGSPFALGALAATVGFIAHGLFDDLVIFPTVAATWWLLVGVGAGLSGNGEIPRVSETSLPA